MTSEGGGDCPYCPTAWGYGLAKSLKDTFGNLGIHPGRNPPEWVTKTLLNAPATVLTLAMRNKGAAMFVGFVSENTIQAVSNDFDPSKMDLFDIGANTVLNGQTPWGVATNNIAKTLFDYTFEKGFLSSLDNSKPIYDTGVDALVGGIAAVLQYKLGFKPAHETMFGVPVNKVQDTLKSEQNSDMFHNTFSNFNKMWGVPKSGQNPNTFHNPFSNFGWFKK